MDVYDPFPLTDLPLELIALVSDLVDDVDDLASMSLVSHLVRNGVLLSRPWIVVEAVVAATDGDEAAQRRILHNRRECASYACKNGLLHAFRALNLSRSEVTDSNLELVRTACNHGQLEVLKHLHTTYALTAEELDADPSDGSGPPSTAIASAVVGGHHEVMQYLHDVAGAAVPRSALAVAYRHSQFKTISYLHFLVGFTPEDACLLDMHRSQVSVISRILRCCRPNRLIQQQL